MINPAASLPETPFVAESMATAPMGEIWADNNLLWSGFASLGAPQSQFSPVDGRLIQTLHVLAPSDLIALFAAPLTPPEWSEHEIQAFALRLEARLRADQAAWREAVAWETGFSGADCDEIVAAALEYLRGFAAHFAAIQSAAPTLRYAEGETGREISLQSAAWGTVAVMLPQNALLFLGVVCIVNALLMGNRVVLRAPIAGGRTAAMLARAVSQAAPPLGSVALVVAKGREFLEAAYASPSPALIHYLGASSFGGDILKNAFQNGKTALIDGSGNTWVWVGERNDAAEVARALTAGATRYNGQTCTSINGAVIHPAIFPAVRDELQALWAKLRAGDTSRGASIGGLFDAAQANHCQKIVQESGGQVLCGGTVAGNRLNPTLVLEPGTKSDLVREGVFGPVVWLAPGTREEFVALWPSNRYPLCAGVWERGADAEADAEADANWWLKRLPQLARLVVNGDPSVEHIYEPWGGYAGAGANSVGFWHQKYARPVSVDARRGN